MTPGFAAAIFPALIPLAPPPSASDPATTQTSPADTGDEDVTLLDLSTTGFPEGVPDDSAYRRYLDDQANLLIHRAEESGSPRDHLQAANWILARQIEPSVSRVLLGIAHPDDGGRILPAVHRATEQLDQARATLTADDSTTQPHDAGDQPSLAAQRLEQVGTLETFAQAIAAVFDESDAEEKALRLRAAAFKMAILLEEDRPAVASAAILWQALLFDRLEQPDRALEVLPLPTVAPAPGGQNFHFFARLLRCRLLAERGGYPAACSLLLRVEKLAYEWFPTPPEGAEAARAAILTRMQILAQWKTALETTSPAEADWCRRSLATARAQVFSVPSPRALFRLEQAVPILVESTDESAPARETDGR